MKVIHVANRAEKKNARAFYSLPYKINNGLIRNNHNVIWFSDRDIARAEAIIPSAKLGKGKCNDRLIAYCGNFEPDLLLLAHADLITSKTIRQIKKNHPNIRVAQYNIDPLGHDRNVQAIRSKLDVVDFTLVTTAGSILKHVSSESAPAAFIPNPIDASIDIHRCHESRYLDTDVFFAGQKTAKADPEDWRSRVSSLPKLLPDSKVTICDSLWASEYMRQLGQSKIGLNLSQTRFESGMTDRANGYTGGDGTSLYCYSSDRISQYLGNGLLTISPSCFSLSRLYGKNGLVEVDSFDDMVDKVRFYVSNDTERRRVAANGYNVAHAEYNSTLVVQYLIESVFGQKHSHSYCWPTETYRAGNQS